MSNYLGFTPTNSPEYYFISYNNEDAGRIGPLACEMDRAGIPLWYDYGIEYGEKWGLQINQKLGGAKAMLLFFTKGILRKEDSYVQKEFKIARYLHKKVIILMCDEIGEGDVPLAKVDWWIDLMDNQCLNIFRLGMRDALGEIKRALGIADAGAKKEGQKPEEDGGSPAEMYRRGIQCLKEKDDVKGVYWIRRAAEHGSAEAQFVLGMFYEEGRAGTKDFAEALNWYRKAAAQGYAGAYHKIGYYYEYGRGTGQDYAEAAKWYRKGAEQGDRYAQAGLARIYAFALGVDQDYTEAEKWYRKAAEQGHTVSQYNLGMLCQNGQGTKQDSEEAVRWFIKAAEKGYAKAQNSLGVCYERGLGIRQDYAEAAAWYRKAAEQGYDVAQSNPGLAYLYGRGVKQDDGEAARWFRKAAEQGNQEAAKALEHLKDTKAGTGGQSF